MRHYPFSRGHPVTPRSAGHRFASPSFSGRRGLPPDSLCLRKTGFALPLSIGAFAGCLSASLDRHQPDAFGSVPATWHRPQGVTVPAAALRPRAASGESDAGAPPSSRSYPASSSPLHAGTTTPSAFSGPFDSPRSLYVALFQPDSARGPDAVPSEDHSRWPPSLRGLLVKRATERDERQSTKKRP